MGLSWMAWTWQTATFFVVILVLITSMGIWEWLSPGGGPRDGILGLRTTRGDRLFISLLTAAFIHLAWLGLVGTNLIWAMLLSLIAALMIFRWV
jgi:predicted small integral membrane protein